MHGWIILDKPIGPGSTQMVSAVKRALRTGGYGKYKVGHGGTLDPLASGVLPIAIGEATKLSGRMLDADKGYDFTIGFGVQTDTLDLEGKVVAESDARPTLADIEAALPRFTGPIEQVPPIYSALKIDGQRAYDLARAGEEVEMKRRAVTIRSLSILPRQEVSGWIAPGNPRSCWEHDRPETVSAQLTEGEDAANSGSSLPPPPSPSAPPPPGGGGLSEITLSARVSKGTYIRSLARDIALAVGSVGHVTMLRRTKAGPFTLEQANQLDKLDEFAKGQRLEQLLLPLTAGLDDIPALSVTPDQARALREGRKLIGIAAQAGLQLAIEGDTPIALVETIGPETRVVRGINM